MNVIIANQYKDALSNLNIDIIKRMDGEFDVETIIDTFQNFYFNRMILDVTALRDYFNISTIQRLCTTLDASKIILYLPDDPRINNSFLSRIISLGIYNFTRDLSGIMYLMNNPNSYRDVAQYHDLAANTGRMSSPTNNSGFTPSNNVVSEPVNQMNNSTSVPITNAPMQEQPFNQVNPMPTNNTPNAFGQGNVGMMGSFNNTGMMNPSPFGNVGMANNMAFENAQMQGQFGNMPYNQMSASSIPQMGMMPNMGVNVNPFGNMGMGNNQPMQQPFYQQSDMSSGNMNVQPFGTTDDFNQSEPVEENTNPFNINETKNDTFNDKVRIIGFKDLTEDAGATTLIYMLKKQISDLKVLAVEFNSNDFSYFNDSELLSTSANSTDSFRSKFRQFDLVLLDLNKYGGNIETVCNELIYLLEPSTIKLNSLMRREKGVFTRIKGKKLVLNKSLLTVSDVKEFEYEAKVDVFYNIPPLDERKEHQMVLDSFLSKLHISSGKGNRSSNKNSSGLFNMFKKNE